MDPGATERTNNCLPNKQGRDHKHRSKQITKDNNGNDANNQKVGDHSRTCSSSLDLPALVLLRDQKKFDDAVGFALTKWGAVYSAWTRIRPSELGPNPPSWKEVDARWSVASIRPVTSRKPCKGDPSNFHGPSSILERERAQQHHGSLAHDCLSFAFVSLAYSCAAAVNRELEGADIAKDTDDDGDDGDMEVQDEMGEAHGPLVILAKTHAMVIRETLVELNLAIGYTSVARTLSLTLGIFARLRWGADGNAFQAHVWPLALAVLGWLKRGYGMTDVPALVLGARSVYAWPARRPRWCSRNPPCKRGLRGALSTTLAGLCEGCLSTQNQRDQNYRARTTPPASPSSAYRKQRANKTKSQKTKPKRVSRVAGRRFRLYSSSSGARPGNSDSLWAGDGTRGTSGTCGTNVSNLMDQVLDVPIPCSRQREHALSEMDSSDEQSNVGMELKDIERKDENPTHLSLASGEGTEVGGTAEGEWKRPRRLSEKKESRTSKPSEGCSMDIKGVTRLGAPATRDLTYVKELRAERELFDSLLRVLSRPSYLTFAAGTGCVKAGRIPVTTASNCGCHWVRCVLQLDCIPPSIHRDWWCYLVLHDECLTVIRSDQCPSNRKGHDHGRRSRPGTSTSTNNQPCRCELCS